MWAWADAPEIDIVEKEIPLTPEAKGSFAISIYRV